MLFYQTILANQSNYSMDFTYIYINTYKLTFMIIDPNLFKYI